MKLRGAIAILAIAGTASARKIEVPGSTTIPVCIQGAITPTNLFLAEKLAADMFAGVGVDLQWRGWNSCPVGDIRVSLSQNTLESDHPGSFAYALPYEGTHILVFLDRIDAWPENKVKPYLLAHVMVHEITHVIEGVCRHSKTGMMKPAFLIDDIADMQLHPIPFAKEDVVLIHAALQRRAAVSKPVNTSTKERANLF